MYNNIARRKIGSKFLFCIESWSIEGQGILIKVVFKKRLFKKYSKQLANLNLFYINELINRQENSLITWQQLKILYRKTSYGKKAIWFCKIEEILLKYSSSHALKDEYIVAEPNILAFRINSKGPIADKRKKDWNVYRDKKSIINNEECELKYCQNCLAAEEIVRKKCIKKVKISSIVGALPSITKSDSK
ncbi:13272_t:CDS:2 [Gigaspora margarita]|uniref:13272_t:CDS:1 n=1 Tax=Gigaspora margarita TaxID=4874 RepID=A0ABN7UHI1_GIGMA|nr:13272_t:CDS:2 [Gigaspora margarita]